MCNRSVEFISSKSQEIWDDRLVRLTNFLYFVFAKTKISYDFSRWGLYEHWDWKVDWMKITRRKFSREFSCVKKILVLAMILNLKINFCNGRESIVKYSWMNPWIGEGKRITKTLCKWKYWKIQWIEENHQLTARNFNKFEKYFVLGIECE